MKVIDRSNRETLLEFLKLPDDIRKYDINKQYYILHKKIESLEKSFFIDDFIIIHSDYVSNTNQDIAWQSVLKNFQIKDYLNAYFDIINYIEENKEIRNIYEIEMNNIKSILRGINKKMQEAIDLDIEYKNINIKLKENIAFNIYMVDGSIVDNEQRKSIELEDNNIKIYWNRNIINVINNNQIANELRKIIAKYEAEINEYAKDWTKVRTSPKGTIFNHMYIYIDSKTYKLQGMSNNEIEAKFYKKMKENIYSFIETIINSNNSRGYIRKTCIDKDGHRYEETTILGEMETNNNLKLSEQIELLDINDNTDINNINQEEYTDINNINQEEYTNKIANLLEIPTEHVTLYALRIDDLCATYYYNPTRGGKSIIVSDDGSYLLTNSSSIPRAELTEEYKSGKRNGNFKENTDNINTNIYKDDVNEKYNGISGIISIKNILIK